MRRFRTLPIALALGGLLAVVGCSSNQQGDDANSIYLTVDINQRPLAMNIYSGNYLQLDTVTVKSQLKVPDLGSSTMLDTRLEGYYVDWTRVDGGKTASPRESFAVGGLVPAGGTTTFNNYPFMTPAAQQRPPLDQLFPYNGGVDRETGNTMIRQRATVTYYGHTVSGQAVQASTNFEMDFYYQAPTGARPAAVKARPVGAR